MSEIRAIGAQAGNTAARGPQGPPPPPRPEMNPAGPQFQKGSENFVNQKTKEGKIDEFETKRLSEMQTKIQEQVKSDQEKGLDPTQDPELAKMQMNYRQTTDLFANFNPESAGKDKQ